MKKMINLSRKGLMKSLLIKPLAFPLWWGNSQLRQKHLNKWKAYKGYHQSKMLMSEPQPSRAKELQAMTRPNMKGAVGLLTGHTTLRAHVLKLGLAQQQDCRLSKVVCISYVIVQHWHAKDTERWVIFSRSPRV